MNEAFIDYSIESILCNMHYCITLTFSTTRLQEVLYLAFLTTQISEHGTMTDFLIAILIKLVQ